jgi:hypothetical protein
VRLYRRHKTPLYPQNATECKNVFTLHSCIAERKFLNDCTNFKD